MSVWSDMGFLANGETFGVDPEIFFRTVLLFWQTLKAKCYPWTYSPTPPEEHFIKRSETLHWYWNELTFWGYAPTWNIYGYTHPIPAINWNSPPDWITVLHMNEQDILGEPIYPDPFLNVANVMDPGLAKQRRELIKLTRYAVIPLGGFGYWYGNIPWGQGRREVKEISCSVPDYWAQATTKIGICGESGKPISGNFWTTESYYFKYTSEQSVTQNLYIYGAVDLATHPDFAQYFDIA